MESETNLNILKNPILKSGVDRGSRVAVCIDLFCRNYKGEDIKVGSGSGFFHTRHNTSYLITNWHVLTGRNPNEPSVLLEGFPESPSAFQIHLARNENPNHFVPSELYPLYEDGKPQWLETHRPKASSNGIIDLAAIAFNFPDSDEGPLITPIDQFSPDGKDFLYIGRDVVIIGYPFGINELNPYPIWKRGYVASEPSLLIGGMPKFYIDSPGRPGMSGSPIFMISKGIGLPIETAKLFQNGSNQDVLKAFTSKDVDELKSAPEVNILQFAGVYSGSVGDSSLERLRVGVAWHAGIVDRLFTNTEQGYNPHPPPQ